ncbi:MAG: cytochrome c-type biogenesis protein [Thermomonas sp.]
MRGKKILLMICMLFLFSVSAFAQVNSDSAPLQFQNKAEEARFHALAAELRCVMCQNQSLADSNALIALSLRHEVLELMQKGRTDAQIKEFLVARYGEFVLYKPRVEPSTWLLWLGPLALLLMGAGVVVALIRKRTPGTLPVDDKQEW